MLFSNEQLTFSKCYVSSAKHRKEVEAKQTCLPNWEKDGPFIDLMSTFRIYRKTTMKKLTVPLRWHLTPYPPACISVRASWWIINISKKKSLFIQELNQNRISTHSIFLYAQIQQYYGVWRQIFIFVSKNSIKSIRNILTKVRLNFTGN